MKKLITLLFALAVLTVTVFMLVLPAAAEETVSYLSPIYVDANDPAKGLSGWETKTITDYKYVTSSDTAWSGWYVMDGSFTINNAVEIHGNVHLILLDGCDLTVISADDEAEKAGIYCYGAASFTVYAQSTNKNTMGKLTATGDGGGAGIGGANNKNGENITINGGIITANGTICTAVGAAGIGGGADALGKNITINGGYVYANGTRGGAGIGGGCNANGENIVINGGEVHASGGSGVGVSIFVLCDAGAGIGGGDDGDGNNITINGGEIVADGGEASDADGKGAAGIGGGAENNANNIKITGGYIVANGGYNAAGIGGGGSGDAKTIEITGGVVYAHGKNGGAGIGGGNDGDADDIKISGGYVYAESVLGNGCTGIGGGCDGKATKINITGGYIKAYAGYEGAAIGGGKNEYGGDIYISNAYVYASGSGAAAIGGGKGGSYKNICIGTESRLIENGSCFGVGSGLSSDIGILIVEHHGYVEISAPSAKYYDDAGNIQYFYGNIQDALKIVSTVYVYLMRDDIIRDSPITIDAGQEFYISLEDYDLYNLVGNTGSAIINNGTLTISGEGCIADADIEKSPENGGNIYNNGTMKLYANVIGGVATKNGGNIYNAGNLTSYAATVSDGSASLGGNIYNCGTLKVTSNSTVTDGTAAEYGGNIYNDKSGNLTLDWADILHGAANCGAGIYNAGTLTMSVFNNGCDDTFHHSLISGNFAQNYGGGIFNTKEATFKYTAGEFSGNRANKANSNLVYYADTTLDMSIGAVQYTYIIDDNNNLTEVTYVPQTGSVFSPTSLGMIIAGGVAILAAAVAVIVRAKKKKSKPVPADGAFGDTPDETQDGTSDETSEQ